MVRGNVLRWVMADRDRWECVVVGGSASLWV